MSADIQKFLVRLFIFCIPVIIAIGYIEFKISSLKTSYEIKMNIIKAHLPTVEVVVVGSSHALHGINPEYFDFIGINLANTSQSIYYDTQLIAQYGPQMPHLKVVIFSLSYFSLGYDLKGTEEAWRQYYYWKFMGIREPGLKWDLRRYSYILLYSWSQVREFMEEDFHIQLVQGMNQLGWQEAERANSLAKDQFGKDRVDYHNRLIHEENRMINEDYLRKTIILLNQRGIKSLFVRMPVSPRYFQYTDPQVYQRDTEIIRNLCKTYGCRFFNGQNLRYSQELFADDDHLNTQGAQKFSRALNVQIHKLTK